MKFSLTIAALLIAGVASAQQDHSPVQLANNKSIDPPAAKLLTELPNGSKVYALPQDNMPCVVPQMNQPAIPNAADKIKEPEHGLIPNPAPKLNIPMRKKLNTAPTWISFDMRRKN